MAQMVFRNGYSLVNCWRGIMLVLRLFCFQETKISWPRGHIHNPKTLRTSVLLLTKRPT